jgi:hypothetical protein
VYQHLFTWLWKQIQFAKHCVILRIPDNEHHLSIKLTCISLWFLWREPFLKQLFSRSCITSHFLNNINAKMVSSIWLGKSSSDRKLENLAAEQMSAAVFDRGVESEITHTVLYLTYQLCVPFKVIPFTNSAFLRTPTISEMYAVGCLLTCCLGLQWLLTSPQYWSPICDLVAHI